MLERLRIKDFQKWEELDVEFDPYVTTFIGETDAGKSTALRAIRFIAMNTPAKGIIRWGARTTRCELSVDGRTIIREKGAAVNLYQLDGVVFEGLGQGGVPRDVQRLLNVSGLNFGGQHDLPFWFGLSAPEVSRQINAVVDLSAIDDALSAAAGEVRKARAAVEVSHDRLEEAREAAANLSWAVKASEQLSSIERLQAEIDAVASRWSTIASLVEQAQEAEQRKQNAVSKAQDIARVVRLGEELAEVSQRHSRLHGLVTAAQQCEQIAAQPRLNLTKLDQLRKDYEEVSQRREALQSLIDGVERWQQVVETAGTVLEKTRAELASVKQCPACGQQLPKRTKTLS